MRRLVAALAAALILGALPPAPARAQEAPTLERAESLAREGRTGEARDVLSRWWSDGYASSPDRDRQRALWLRGRLTVDPARAMLDFQRLVIEFPGGPFSDQALFRLAQADFAAGDSAGAAAEVGRLAREYPGSSVRRDAQAWLAAAGSPPPPPVPPPAAEAVEAGGGHDAAASPPAHGIWAVQLGAFASRARAETLRRRAADAGFDARLALLPDSRLIRVRVGRFPTQDGAAALMKRLRDAGFAATVVRDSDKEEGVGDEPSPR